MSISRCILRWGLVGGAGLAITSFFVGTDTVAAGLAQLRGKAQTAVQEMIDDPVLLRRQLEQLAEQYPDRIAEVRGEMAEVNHQIAQLDRDIEIAARVVAYTSEDLTVLKTRLVKAEAEIQTTSRPVFIRFEGVRFDLDDARTEALRIGNVRQNYRDRLEVDRHQRTMLEQQNARLQEIAGKLDNDFETYQAQLWSLDRQIDAIQRNDRLIELMEQQQETLASYDRFDKVANLKQVEAKLAELRTIQEAQLETLSNRGFRSDYEGKARLDIDGDGDDLIRELLEDLEAEEDSTEPSGVSHDSVALLTPIVIE
jgi:chromosome segregation ATPase